MTTAAEVVGEARRLFMTSQRDRFNVLSGAITATAPTLTLTYTTTAEQVLAGMTIEIGLESMLVTDVSAATATVIRGFNGSTKANHASGDLIRINPIVLDLDLFNAMNHELRDLSSPQNGLFQVDYVDITPNGNTGYNAAFPLAADGAPIIDVLAIRQDETRGYWARAYDWELQRGPNPDFTSGYGLLLKGGFSPGRQMRVWYKAGFAVLRSLADDVTTVAGFPDEAVDILAMGAAIRGANPREIGRNFTERQGEPRRATEVLAGAQLQAPAAVRQMYTQRKSAERARLIRHWRTFGARV